MKFREMPPPANVSVAKNFFFQSLKFEKKVGSIFLTLLTSAAMKVKKALLGLPSVTRFPLSLLPGALHLGPNYLYPKLPN